jgi:hypothetical protein
MNTRFLAAKICFALATLLAIFGFIVNRTDIPKDPYLLPLLLLFLPRLLPFAVALLSAIFGLIYLGAEHSSRRRPNLALVIAQLAFFLAAMYGHLGMLRYSYRVLDEQPTPNLPVPAGSSLLFFLGLAVSIMILIFNLLKSTRRNLRKA